MPKVLHVIARINQGGTARYLENLIPGLQNLGWKVLVATGDVQHGEEEDQIVNHMPIRKIRHLGRKISPFHDFSARESIKRLIAEFQPDIIHSHTFKAGLLVRTLKLDLPIIHNYHGHLLFDPEFTGLKLKLIIMSEKLLARRSTVLLTTGNHVSQALLKHQIGEQNQYVSIVPNTTPINLIGKSEALRELGLDTNLTIIVWAARFTQVKNPSLLVEIAKLLPEYLFAAFGDGDLLQEISNSAPSNVKFFGWRKPELFWSIADLFLSTSLNEGLSNSIMEAASLGLPIVALNIDGNLEILGEYANVSLAENDHFKLASLIKNRIKNQKSEKLDQVTQVDFCTNIAQLYEITMTSTHD